MQRLLQRLLFSVAGLVLAVTPVFAQGGDQAGWLRFVHVIPGAASIDIYIDGELTISGLDFGQASNYVQVNGGTHEITVTQHGVTTSLWQQEVNLAPNAALTLVASSTDPLSFQVYQDDLNPLTLGNTRLTAIHAIANADTVDLVLADGRAVMPRLQYNQPYGTLDLAAQTYEIAVVPEGESVENAILPPTTLALNSGASYMAVVYGTATEASLLLLSAPTQPEAEGGNVRLVHGIPGSAAVDIYVDNALVAPSLSFEGSVTGFIALPEGEHSISVRFGGETDDLVSDSVEVANGDYFTLIVAATEDGVGIQRFDDPVSTITPDVGVLNIVNILSEESTVSASSADVELLGGVETGESDSAILEPSADPLTATINIDDESSAFDLLDTVYGGVYYTVLAVNGADGAQAVALAPVSLAQGVASAPGDQMVRVQLETTAEVTTPPTEVAAQPTAAPTEPAPVATEAAVEATPEVSQPLPTAVPPTATGPTARVLLDPGANLHLRQFPSSTAFSLGLIPADSALEVIGRRGAPEIDPEVTPDPAATPDPEVTPFVDPVTLLTSDDQDLNPADTWLYVVYQAADGMVIEGWVNALYLAVTDRRGLPQRLALLPTVPENRSGFVQQGTVQPQITATPLALDTVIATVNLDAGANLHLRRNPNANAESLALIPNGAQLTVTGRIESSEWLQVSYEGQQGWISSLYVTLSFNSTTYESSRLTVISTPTPTETPTATPGA